MRPAPQKRLLLSHPTPNANWRHLSLAVAEAGWLEELHMSLAWGEGWSAARWLPQRVRKEVSRRSVPAAVVDKLVVHPWPELGRILAQRSGLLTWVQQETGRFCIEKVFRSQGAAVAKRVHHGLDGVIAGEDGALEVFQAAEKFGVRRILEMPTAAPEVKRKLYSEEAELRPSLEPSLPALQDSHEKLRRKSEELDAADIVLVANNHVYTSLVETGISPKKLFLVPYGCDTTITPRQWSSMNNGPLHIGFVGSVAQHKGLGYLLEAIQLLTPASARLSVLGSGYPEVFRTVYGDVFKYYYPREHSGVLEFLKTVDVLVLPSLSEGFGMVVTEAMACGVPVIATENTCASTMIRDGIEGFVVPIRNAEAIAEKLEFLIRNPDAAPAMGIAARRCAEMHPWERYRSRIREVIETEANF